MWTSDGAKSSLRPVLAIRCVPDEIQTAYSVQECSEKGECNATISGCSFFCFEAGMDTDLPACSVTFTYTACRLAHPKPMVGCWDLPISRFRHVTQSQLKNSAQTYSYYINSAQKMLAVFLCVLINTKTFSRYNRAHLCTTVLIYLPARCGDGQRTISWPTNWCRTACCHFQAGHGDRKPLEGNENPAAVAMHEGLYRAHRRAPVPSGREYLWQGWCTPQAWVRADKGALFPNKRSAATSLVVACRKGSGAHQNMILFQKYSTVLVIFYYVHLDALWCTIVHYSAPSASCKKFWKSFTTCCFLCTWVFFDTL